MRKFVSKLNQSLEISTDTCLSSTKHRMDYNLEEKLFGQMLQEYLLDLGFVPSLAESSVYMR